MELMAILNEYVYVYEIINSEGLRMQPLLTKSSHPVSPL